MGMRRCQTYAAVLSQAYEELVKSPRNVYSFDKVDPYLAPW